MANLNKSAIAKAAGVSYKTVQRKWSAMTKAALSGASGSGGGTLSHDFAVEWFQSSVDSRTKKSPRKITASASASASSDSSSKPSNSAKSGDSQPEHLVIQIGESYPEALSFDEAKKLTDIEKNKASVGKYQRRLIRLFIEGIETELNSATTEIHNFLVKECDLTQEQSGRLNSLIEKLVSTLRASSSDSR